MKVLITDKLGDVGLEYLNERPGIETVVSLGLDEEALCQEIESADALIIRSGTTVTPKLLDAAKNLRVIGRAGIGVDNVDVPAATERGIVVMNTPDANATTTAELTLAHLFSVSRRLPHADASLRRGEWARSQFMGHELTGKTIGVVGFGTIGRIVADRCSGLRMRVLAHDPFVTEEAVRETGAEPAELDTLLASSDYVTLHCPKNDATRGLINAERLALMKKGAFLINCARGGLVDEGALRAALESGHLAGAALDVFDLEPPGSHPLLKMENVVCTPHLGASTREAQAAVSSAIARQVATFLETGEALNAVNSASVSSEERRRIGPYLDLARLLGAVLSRMSPWPMKELEVRLSGLASGIDPRPISTETLVGILQSQLDTTVNSVNAPHLAKRQGISIVHTSSEDSPDYVSLMTLTARSGSDTTTVSGTLLGGRHPRLVRLQDFEIEVVPEGTLLITLHHDRPGVIGALGSLLGKESVNISRMQLGLSEKRSEALAVLGISQALSKDMVDAVRSIDSIIEVWQATL